MLLTESVNGKVNYGPENPPQPPGESLFWQNIFNMDSQYLPKIPFTFLHFTFSNSLLTDRVLFWFYGLISPNRFCEVLLATGPSCSHTSSPLLPTNISHRATITVEYTTTDSFFRLRYYEYTISITVWYVWSFSLNSPSTQLVLFICSILSSFEVG